MKSELSLPMLVMTPTDLKRLIRELSVLDDYLVQQTLRAPGQPMAKLPRTSRLLDETAAANGLNLLEAPARQRLSAFLAGTEKSAPVIHISFAADPSSAFLLKIVAWFRLNIDPLAMVRVGLQPNIAAGCVVRTTNRYFDCSLRKSFERNRHVLHDMLVASAEPEVPAPAGQTAAAAMPAAEVPA